MTRRVRHGSALTATLAAIALSLSACEGSTSGAASDPTESANGERATSASGAAVPTVADAEPQLPVSFTGDDDKEISVEDIDKVFVLDDATMEIMNSLGLAENIGIAPESTLVETYAANAEDRVKATGSGEMTVEGVVGMNPSVVIGTNITRQAEIVEKLQSAEVPATLIDSAQEPADKIRKTAELLGVAESGAQLADQVQSQLDEAEAVASSLPAAERTRVLVLSSTGAGDTGNTTAAGTRTPADGIIAKAGAINAGAESGIERYESVTPEGLIAAGPEAVIVAESELADLGGADGIWEEVAGLSGTPAAETQRLIIMNDMELTGGAVSAGAGVLNLQAALAEQQ